MDGWTGGQTLNTRSEAVIWSRFNIYMTPYTEYVSGFFLFIEEYFKSILEEQYIFSYNLVFSGSISREYMYSAIKVAKRITWKLLHYNNQ